MRKILISLLMCLLLIGTAFFMVNGMNKISTKGFKGLSEKNDELEETISQLSNIISVTYENTLSNLRKTANTLRESKTEYENQAILSSSYSSSYASKLEFYDIDYLWTKLGNYAKDEGVVIKIDVVASTASNNLYNLNFTVTGEYINITDFIYDIENDSKLGFKIDGFKMTSGSGDGIIATFACNDIPINVGTVDSADASHESEQIPMPNEGTSTNTETSTQTNTTNATVNTNTNTNTSTSTQANTTSSNNITTSTNEATNQ